MVIDPPAITSVDTNWKLRCSEICEPPKSCHVATGMATCVAGSFSKGGLIMRMSLSRLVFLESPIRQRVSAPTTDVLPEAPVAPVVRKGANLRRVLAIVLAVVGFAVASVVLIGFTLGCG
jgi:hypothetical protein